MPREIFSVFICCFTVFSVLSAKDDPGSVLRERAEAGDAAAMCLFGQAHLLPRMRISEEKARANETVAAYWFRRAAEAGSPEGMYRYAVCLDTGLGVEKNRGKSYEWLEKSAKAGYKPARLRLAETDRIGIPGDPENKFAGKPALPGYALFKLRELADEEFPPAELVYARLLMLSEDSAAQAEAFRVLNRAAGRADAPPEIFRRLAECFDRGRGTKHDSEKTLFYLRRAAKKHDSEALFHLAYLHEYGKYVPENFEKALNLYRISAMLGHGGALFRLGEYYRLVKKDFSKAADFYRKSMKANYPAAASALGELLTEENGGSPPEEAVRSYLFGAGLGDPPSQYRLAQCFVSGTGVPKDENSATYWFAQSAGRGHAAAQYEIARMYLTGSSGLPRSVTKGGEWLLKSAKAGYGPALRLMRSRGM